MYSSKLFLSLRNVSRFLGVTRLIQKVTATKKYEDAFDTALFKNILNGDCVFDIGANIGHYTKLFSEKVGENGTVFAFEPDSVNFIKLEQNIINCNNITVHNVALGDTNGIVSFKHGNDELGATSKVITNNPNINNKDTQSVTISTLDEYIFNNKIQLPNVIKIDTESFEYEIIKGMSALLSNPTLRVIGMEIHFKQLVERNLSDAPQFIVKSLKKSGFDITWTDPSHIIAKRK